MKLVKRIVELEKKIAELEQRLPTQDRIGFKVDLEEYVDAISDDRDY